MSQSPAADTRFGQAGAANSFHKLTERELEVLRLIANGKNNQEITEILVITEKTVKSYITNILSKLHLSDCTQAAVYAWQAAIVRRRAARRASCALAALDVQTRPALLYILRSRGYQLDRIRTASP